MSQGPQLKYFRLRWPDELVPPGEPLWLLYEVDEATDWVLRTVFAFPDGSITRNSIELELLYGGHCVSLVHGTWKELSNDLLLLETSPDEFEKLWSEGVDESLWFVR